MVDHQGHPGTQLGRFTEQVCGVLRERGHRRVMPDRATITPGLGAQGADTGTDF